MGDSEALDVDAAPALVEETHEVGEEPGASLRPVLVHAAPPRRAAA